MFSNESTAVCPGSPVTVKITKGDASLTTGSLTAMTAAGAAVLMVNSPLVVSVAVLPAGSVAVAVTS